MRVKIVKAKPWMRSLSGDTLSAGDTAEVEPAVGNNWATLGLAVVVLHDPPSPGGKSSQIARNEHTPETDDSEDEPPQRKQRNRKVKSDGTD